MKIRTLFVGPAVAAFSVVTLAQAPIVISGCGRYVDGQGIGVLRQAGG